ncbi:hypothetical protein CDAR_525201 [Caerostris darwini]|uniref:Uncharacterized protein n=1 Tax=Caerostris darwini TaxID=1538125 RepID=A0AAV4Q3D8_9ARAC|nr:hypothetical protein CDAR_525201 [Caerostris darwini]
MMFVEVCLDPKKFVWTETSPVSTKRREVTSSTISSSDFYCEEGKLKKNSRSAPLINAKDLTPSPLPHGHKQEKSISKDLFLTVLLL